MHYVFDGRVVERLKTPDSESGVHWFESSRVFHFLCLFLSSSVLVERRTVNALVAGSSPAWGATEFRFIRFNMRVV
jgi:hypothetical protein